jgi:hypothetical protein
MIKKAAGLAGAKSNFQNHRSLRQRFRATLSGALPLLSSGITVKFPILIESVILEQCQTSHEPDVRVLNAIAIGLWQHQDLSSLPNFFAHLDDLVIALLIALACRDALNPKTAIADICDFLQNMNGSSRAISTPISRLVEQLQLVRTLVEQGASIAIALTTLKSVRAKMNDLDHSNIAFGLYCWLSTPHAWHLAVPRAKQVQPELGAAIGAIAAAYSGNIPAGDQPIMEMGIAMGDRLLAAWAGVYNLQKLDSISYAAVTAPDILGKRI